MNKILQGDALIKLKELKEKSVNMVMTSPPYWALRDYGTASWEGGDENCNHKTEHTSPKSTLGGGKTTQNVSSFYKDVCGKCGAKRVDNQLGLEPTFDLYINKLCDIFDEVKRVLRDDGTCWVNLGDTYGGSGNASGHKEDTKNLGYTTKDMGASKGNQQSTKGMEKSLVMIPFRFAIEMINRGWILRNVIIWHKPNCMPCSVKDRFTVDFEYIFFFSKKKEYYFETQYEELITKENRPTGVIRNREYNYDSKENNNPKSYLKQDNVPSKNSNTYKGFNKRYIPPSQGRNKRTVWRICPQPFKEAHFAVYPEELCETPIKAGCPEFVCVKCGNPKVKDYEKGNLVSSGQNKMVIKKQVGLNKTHKKDPYGDLPKREHIDLGYKPTCKCNTYFTGGVVLDPFFGAGTTGLVALKQNKKFIGIELNKEYIEIAEKRLKPFLEQTKLDSS